MNEIAEKLGWPQKKATRVQQALSWDPVLTPEARIPVLNTLDSLERQDWGEGQWDRLKSWVQLIGAVKGMSKSLEDFVSVENARTIAAGAVTSWFYVSQGESWPLPGWVSYSGRDLRIVFSILLAATIAI